MRKLLTILLAFIYITTTSGVVITTHYCMGEIAGHAIGVNDTHLCGVCGMSNEGCCHDDLSLLKVNDDHQFVHSFVSFPSIDLQLPITASNENSFFYSTKNVDFAQGPAPPERIVDRQAMLCVFRI